MRTDLQQASPDQLLPESKLRELKKDIFSLVDQDKNEEHSYSNTFANIDLVPRFVRGFGNNIVPVALAESQNLILENKYEFGGSEFVCRVKPTIIEKEVEGKVVQFHAHPGEREEIIEKIIFKIACSDGLKKVAMAGSQRWGVKFSLYQIREELRKIKKTRPYHDIRESLLILRDSKTTIAQIIGKREIELTASIFTDAAFEVNGNGRARDKYFIVLSDYVVEQIMNFNYRQYPFEAINSHGYSLARFFHIFLKHQWINATLGHSKDFSLNQIYKNYGNADLKVEFKRRDFRTALGILVESGWIVSVPTARKVTNIFQKSDDNDVDFIYTLEPTRKFVEEVRRANAKLKGIRAIVDKSIVSGVIPDLAKRVFVHAEPLVNSQE
jgi:hypothetical protein